MLEGILETKVLQKLTDYCDSESNVV